MKKRMITIGCLIAMAGVLTILNSKVKLDSLNNETENLSLYKSIKAIKESRLDLGENREKGTAIADKVAMKQSSQKSPSVDSILNKDIHKLAQELRVDEDESYRLKELNNFRTPLKDILSRVDPKGYARFLEDTIKKIHSCLEIDFCGMEKDSPDSPYFDEKNTVAHKTLLRSLSALEILVNQDDGSIIRDQLDSSMLERLLENNNADIQEKAMILLKEKLGKEQSFETIMSYESSFSGLAKAHFYEELANSSTNETQRENYLESLAKTLESSDPHTVLSVVEKIPKFSVEKEKLSRIAQGLCRFHADPGQHYNWLSVSHEIKKLKEQDLIESDFDCL